MAKAKSIVKLNGKLGDVVFFERGGKTIVRTKREDMSDRLKNDSCYAGQRSRTVYLKLSNSYATAVYRMAKEEASHLNYKVHNLLLKAVYHLVKEKSVEELNETVVRKCMKGTVLNHLDTLPPVLVDVYEDDVLINCDRPMAGEVKVKLLIGTLPKVTIKGGVPVTQTDMEEVQVRELVFAPADYLKTFRVSLGLGSDQVVVVVIYDEVEGKEWVRVV